MRTAALLLLLAGCVSAPAVRSPPDQFIVRDGSSTTPLAVPDASPAYTPPGGIRGAAGGRGGGLSKVCTPEQNGIGANCRAL